MNKRVHPSKELLSGNYKGLDVAIVELVPKIDPNLITQTIDELKIEEPYSTYYKTVIDMRFHKVLEPAYELACKRQEKDLEGTLEDR